jgi:hypothetical protein
MPKRRRGDRSDNEVEIITFNMPEDRLDSSSTITSAPTTTFTPPAQVFKVSEWTVETDRVSTSNSLYSSVAEPASSASFSKSDHDPHILGAHHDYYDVIDVSDFQPPPEPLQPSGSVNTESSKSSKVRSFVSLLFLRFYLI